MSSNANQMDASLAARARLGVANRSRKAVRHGAKALRSLLRRVVRALLHLAKAIRHALLRLRLAWKGFRYRSRWTGWGGSLWRAATFVRAPRETRERRRAAVQYASRVSCAEMSQAGGFRLLPPDHFPDMAEVVSTCRRLFESKMAGADGGPDASAASQENHLVARRMKGEYLRNLLSNEDLRRNPVLVDFALSDAAMGMAAKYLGTVPHLNRVDLLYSVSRPGDEKVSSQLFHVDPEGLTQVKFFINIFDVDDAGGPFTFIPADETARVIREVDVFRRQHGKPHAGRYLDDEIAAVGAAGSIVRVKGPKGSGVAVDTSRCLHLGSRVQPGAFRLCLYVQYCTTRELGNAFDVERYRADPVRRLAVLHSAASAGGEVSAPHQGAGLS
jgi:hypothetical protein